GVPKPAQVPGRVGEPIRVVDAQSVGEAVPAELEHLAVRDLEDLGILDAYAGELADVEEASVPPRLLVPVEELPSQVGIGPEPVLLTRRHVVWHDVEDDAEPGLAEPPELLLAAEIVRHARRVDDVVAVRRAAARLQHRRQVQVADAEVAEVGHESARLTEAEPRPERQPGRRAQVGAHASRRRTTTERESIGTTSRAAYSAGGAAGSSVESSTNQRRPKRTGGSTNSPGSWCALNRSRKLSS